MAPKIEKSIEVVFFLLILGIFFMVASKYYSSDISDIGRAVIKKFNTQKTYSDYENLAKQIEVSEKTSGEAHFVPVLVYHGVTAGEPKNEEEISLQDFTEQMFELKRRGYQTISITDFSQFVNAGKSIPEKSFVLTFDDGRKDSYYPVDPILKALDFTATIFIITNTLQTEKPSPYYLSIDELKSMNASGRWDLQSHGRDDHGLIVIDQDGTRGRFMSNKKWLADEERLESNEEYQERIVMDLKNSKQDLKDIFGVEAIAYALPAGDYGHKTSNYPDAEDVIQGVLREVYPMSFYQSNPDARMGYYRSNFPQKDIQQYFFRRIKVLGDFSAQRLLDILDASEEKKLPYQDDFLNSDNWILAWGKLNLNGQVFSLQNMDSSNSAAAFLDGTMTWKNYRLSADASLESGYRYNVLARVQNGKNFIGCSFEDKVVKIISVENETARVIAIKPMPLFDPHERNTVGFEINEDVFQCFLNGKMVMKNTIQTKPEMGGIGFSVFSENKETPAILNVFDKVVVTEL